MRKGMLKGAQMSRLLGEGHALWALGCGGQYPEALRAEEKPKAAGPLGGRDLSLETALFRLTT